MLGFFQSMYDYARSKASVYQLKTAASLGNILQVTEILSQNSVTISVEDKRCAIEYAYRNTTYFFELSDHVKVISLLLEDSQDVRALTNIIQPFKFDRIPYEYPKVVKALLSTLSGSLYAKLAIDPPSHIIAEVGEHLVECMNTKNTQAIENVLHFDHRLFIQWALDSNNVELIKALIKNGISLHIEISGKTPLDMAKDRGLSEMVVVLIAAIGESAKITEAQWQALLAQDDQQLQASIEQIAKEQPAHCIVAAAQAAVTSSGLLLTETQCEVVDSFFSDPQRYKYPKDQNVPFSVVKSEEGKSVAIYNGKASGLLTSCLGRGKYSDVKYGQVLDSKTFCAVKVIRKVESIDLMSREADSLKMMNRCLGMRIVPRDDDTTKCYFFIPFLPGICFAEFLSVYQRKQKNLSTQHQAIIFKNLLAALRELSTLQVVHSDLHAGNLILNPADLSVTIIDFGRAQTSATDPVDLMSQLVSGIDLLKNTIINPELNAIFERIRRNSIGIIPTIDQALTEIEQVLIQAKQIPTECLRLPPPILARTPARQKSLKRGLEAIVQPDNDEAVNMNSRTRKSRSLRLANKGNQL